MRLYVLVFIFIFCSASRPRLSKDFDESSLDESFHSFGSAEGGRDGSDEFEFEESTLSPVSFAAGLQREDLGPEDEVIIS